MTTTDWPTRKHPRVLSIAGTDPSGGAGIQADLKSIAALGGYGMCVIAALVAQNTQGVRTIHTPPVQFLREQLDAVADDVEIDAVKIGMLGDRDVARVVTEWLIQRRAAGSRFPVVLDPVMVATSGHRLLEASAEAAVVELAKQADLVTPNLTELAVMDLHVGSSSAGQEPAEISNWDEAFAAAARVAAAVDCAVLVKGGHLSGDETPDAIVDVDGSVIAQVSGPRVETKNTHGTGCSMSSALATAAARTGEWPASLQVVKGWLTGALEYADGLEVGQGNGPIDHGHHLVSAVDALFSSGSAAETNDDDGATAAWWDETAGLRDEIDQLDFLQGLADGSLPREQFTYYLAQDAIYLQAYSRALAELAARAPSTEAREFFAESAVTASAEETELHRQWLGEEAGSDVVGDVTHAYCDFLLARATTDPWEVGVAAILPCYWLYAHIGDGLYNDFVARREAEPGLEHPYESWLLTYHDPGFQEAAQTARRFTDEAAATASPAVRKEMRAAFVRACELERDFFAARP